MDLNTSDMQRHARRGWRTLLGGNVLALSVVSLLNDAASEMIYPLLPLFLTGVLGATPAVLGVTRRSASSTSMQNVAGSISARTGVAPS